MKQELEAEYLATFKKTVAMHETFLTRLATHPVFRFNSFRISIQIRSTSYELLLIESRVGCLNTGVIITFYVSFCG
jgi:hypothetical protein